MIWGLVALAAVAALVTAFAATRDRYLPLLVAKPLTLVVLIALAVALGAPASAAGVALLIALTFSLTGDVLLIDPPGLTQTPPGRLLAGLVSFFAAHVAYLIAFLARPPADAPFPWLGLAALLAAPVLHRLAGRRPLAGSGQLRVAVIAYELVLLGMFVAAWSAGGWLVALGATAFVASDFALANRLFVGRRPWHDAFVMLTYHAAQGLLVFGLLT